MRFSRFGGDALSNDGLGSLLTASLIGLAFGIAVLAMWTVVDRSVESRTFREISLIAILLAPVTAGVIAGFLHAGTIKEGAQSGLIAGILLALFAFLALVTIGVMGVKEGNPIDQPADATWITILVMAGFISAGLLPQFGLGGALGGAIGSKFVKLWDVQPVSQ